MKLISEIVAVVLIVSVTVGTALLVGYFLSSYISKRQSEIPNICLITNKLGATKKNETYINVFFEYVAGKYELRNVTLSVYCDGDELLKYQYNDSCLPAVCNIFEDVETNCFEKIKIIVTAFCEGTISRVAECEGTNCFLY